MRYWTPEEDEIILRDYVYAEHCPITKCERRLAEIGCKRSRSSIRCRHQKLITKSIAPYRGWTRAMAYKFYRYAGKVRKEKLAELVGVTVNAIEAFAYRNHAPIDWHDEFFTASDIARILDVSVQWVTTRFRHGTLDRLNHRNTRQHNMITYTQFRDFLRRYPGELDDLVQKGHKPDMITIVEVLAGVAQSKTGPDVDPTPEKAIIDITK